MILAVNYIGSGNLFVTGLCFVINSVDLMYVDNRIDNQTIENVQYDKLHDQDLCITMYRMKLKSSLKDGFAFTPGNCNNS